MLILIRVVFKFENLKIIPRTQADKSLLKTLFKEYEKGIWDRDYMQEKLKIWSSQGRIEILKEHNYADPYGYVTNLTNQGIK